MATCHSLRVVDDQLLGDPLDVKMFEFTGWAFEELAQKINEIDDEDFQNSPSSIARPPPGMEFGIDDTRELMNVSSIGKYDLQKGCWLHLQNTPIELGNLKSFEFVSQLRRASVIVGQSGSSQGDVYVKGAPECMREICRQDSCKSFPHHRLRSETHLILLPSPCGLRGVARFLHP